ncbi:MAG: acyltransferase family protein [SAR324 cluster bacterium]|nr:acyltransferase family protein [SAR324 cluster bacterium]
MELAEKMKSLLSFANLQTRIGETHKNTGTLGYDPWGYNEDRLRQFAKLGQWIYEKYFRTEAFGLENIPSQGRALIIGNHSGQLPMDGILVSIALLTNPHGSRVPRAMIERFFPTVPFLGNFLNEIGAVVGDPVNCIKMLQRDESVIVFPEGVGGSGKPWKKRYELQRFGTGFLKIAIETRSPIIPVGIVGCEETIPSLGSIDPLARMLGLPYVPISLPVILPAKVYLHFGKPMMFEGDPTNETRLKEMVEEVKNSIRSLIQDGFDKRQRGR